jgi:bifunctional non-homologous end joining protein LigD
MRKAVLASLLRGFEHVIILSNELEGSSDQALTKVLHLGGHGVIAKRRDQPYKSGRSRNWIKVEHPDRRL